MVLLGAAAAPCTGKPAIELSLQVAVVNAENVKAMQWPKKLVLLSSLSLSVWH